MNPADDAELRKLVEWMLRMQELELPKDRMALPLAIEGEKILDAKGRLVGMAHTRYGEAIVKLVNEMGAH